MVAQNDAAFNHQPAADVATSMTPPASVEAATEPARWVNFDAFNRALDMIARSDMTPTDKLVLLGVAMRANKHTGAAWMAANTLGADLGIHRGAVLRSLRALTARGALEVDRHARPGRGKTHAYRLSNYQPCADCALSPTQETKESAQIARNRAQIARQSNLLKRDDQGSEKTIFPEGGEERENAPAAPPDGAETADLPAEVVTAWRWPLTSQARAFLRNMIAAYTAEEVLTAISIAASQPREIERPAAYVKRVLQSRHSALIDAAERAAQEAAAQPATAAPPDHVDDQGSQPAISMTTPAQGDALDQTLERIRADRAAISPTAGAADDQRAATIDTIRQRNGLAPLTPPPAAAGQPATAAQPDHVDDTDSQPAISMTPPASAADDQRAQGDDLQRAFQRAVIDGRPHMTAARILQGARCTNSEPPDMYTITLAPGATQGDLAALLAAHESSVTRVIAALDGDRRTPAHRFRVTLSTETATHRA